MKISLLIKVSSCLFFQNLFGASVMAIPWQSPLVNIEGKISSYFWAANAYYCEGIPGIEAAPFPLAEYRPSTFYIRIKTSSLPKAELISLSGPIIEEVKLSHAFFYNLKEDEVLVMFRDSWMPLIPVGGAIVIKDYQISGNGSFWESRWKHISINGRTYSSKASENFISTLEMIASKRKDDIPEKLSEMIKTWKAGHQEKIELCWWKSEDPIERMMAFSLFRESEYRLGFRQINGEVETERFKLPFFEVFCSKFKTEDATMRRDEINGVLQEFTKISFLLGEILKN